MLTITRIARRAAQAILILILIAGCGNGGIEGTYHHAQGAFVLELAPDNNASVQIFGQTVICSYSVENDRVALTCPEEASMVQSMLGTLARNKDGTLSSASGVLSRRASS